MRIRYQEDVATIEMFDDTDKNRCHVEIRKDGETYRVQALPGSVLKFSDTQIGCLIDWLQAMRKWKPQEKEGD